MPEDIYSYEKFEEFLQRLPQLNIVTEATARNLKESALRLLATYSPDSDEDIRDMDVDEAISRYCESSGVDVSNSTLHSYKSRLASAIEKFIEFQNAHNAKADDVDNEKSKPKRRRRMPKQPAPLSATITDPIKTFDLPIPLRDGMIITVGKLPMDLTIDEAERIATIIKSFAVRQ
ncbi:hypothetical protein Q0L23_28720 [Klebsiella michiganensis]|uniref:hypothetical protein n=1 Tax=Klebsiella TaxID=570 RepID=UPI00265AEA5E|nr:hypothetical protein [Klebsiella michiganensis]WKK00193.1 hypothetical protein Q0L46_11570 [Klebsiella michiganensis]WKK03771.1 hypothetical protein Q0L23_28720 [Klebsiella michiganensis]